MTSETDQLFIQIYTDEHITALLAPALRRRGYIAQTCAEANALGWEDEDHLVHAAEHGMALMTSDASDFIPIVKRWYANNREHAGIIIAPEFSRRQIGILLRWTLRLLDSLTADELCNSVVYLQQFR
jgi:hypothetical protein